MKEGRKVCEEIYAEKKVAAIAKGMSRRKEAGSQVKSDSEIEPDSEEEQSSKKSSGTIKVTCNSWNALEKEKEREAKQKNSHRCL